MKHLVFYDGECGLCDQAVQFILNQDTKGLFVFAPLQGITATKKLQAVPEAIKNLDSIILIENYDHPGENISVLGQGAFRILWLLGGGWALLGWISFLPPFLYNWGYRLVANNRHKFFSQDICILPDPSFKDRFLP